MSIVALLRGSPKTGVLVKFEFFLFNIEASMLFDFVEKGVSFSVKLEAVKKKTSSCFYTRFFL